jgi:hypothetical protein
MFTLKLYRRGLTQAHPGGFLRTMIREYHHIERLQIGENTDEIRAYKSEAGYDYDQWYVGKRESGMTAISDDTHWEWGLVENQSGKTTEHIRPHTYG